MYSNTFNSPFVFDDLLYIVKNSALTNLRYMLDSSEARRIVEPDSLVGYTFRSRLMGYLTFAMNYRVHGLDVAGYHVVNILIHIVNALTVYFLVILTFRTPCFNSQESAFIHSSASGGQADSPSFIALFASLLFISHPVQTQAVTYISQRFASLATMFYLVSLVTYIRFRTQSTVSFGDPPGREHRAQNKEESPGLRSVLWYLCSFFSAVLAMKTKEISFTLPLMIALYEFIFFSGERKRRILYLLPFLVTMLIIPLSIFGMERPLGELLSGFDEATRAKTTMSRWDYIFTEFRVVVTYVRLVFFPAKLNLDYDFPMSHSFGEPAVFLSLMFLLSIIFLGIYLLYNSSKSKIFRVIAFGIFWFFIALSVESSFIPTQDVIFEHRLYLPSVGIFISMAAAFFYLTDRLRLFSGQVIIPAIAAITILLSSLSFARNAVWHDDISLWMDTMEKSPQKPRVYHELGMAYYNRKMLNEAVHAFKTAIKLHPGYELAHKNLGVVYYELGVYEEALKELETVLALKKKEDAELIGNIGAIYLKMGLTDIAIDHLERALRLKPDYASAHHNLGIAYNSKGVKERAGEHFDRARSLDPARYPDG